MNADERQLGDEQHLPSAFLIESGIDDQPSHDENTTLSSTDYFEALYGKLFRGGDCHDTTIQADGHPLAFDVSSGSTPLRSTALSVVNDFDEIESFLTSSDTFPAIQISDMLQPSQYFDELDSTAEKVKIFVDCIPPRVNGSLLSSFFHGLGYPDVVRIDGPKVKVNI